MPNTIRDLASVLLSAKAVDFQFLATGYHPRTTQLPIEESNSLSVIEKIERFNLLSPEPHQCLFRAGVGLAESPSEEEWELAKIIFLMDNELTSLPARPNCPNLFALFLQRNPCLRVLPKSFFDLMPHLKVLNLSKTRITSLPESISQLQNLRQLNLRNCQHLMKLPSEVGKLKCLDLLDLHGTVMNELPEATGQLESLRYLEVSFYGPVDHREYSKLPSELISPGTISKLSHLSNLSIVVHPGDQRWNVITESVVMDMCNSNNLRSLRFCFPKVGHLQLFLQLSQPWKHNMLKKFNFIVGHDIKRMLSRVPQNMELDYSQLDKCLRLVNDKTVPEDAVLQVLTRATAFYLDHHLKIHSLSQFGVKYMIGLEFCVVRECPEMEFIVEGKELAFPLLEHLSLHYLEKFKGIWKLQLPCGSFASLKRFCIHTCRKLEFVFTTSMTSYFPNLEELIVEDCKLIKDIIFAENLAEPDHVMLPKLKSLALMYLPNLVSVWKGCWPSLEHIRFYHCAKLKNLSMGSGTKLKLSIKKIEAEKQWWETLGWDDPSLYQDLQTCFIPFPEEDL